MKPLRISDVSRRTGLSAHTLRYYERIGLLEPISKVGGSRRYHADDVAWIEFLMRLRATGMGIRDMQTYARLRRAGDVTLAQRTELLRRHRDVVGARVAELQGHLVELNRKIAHYGKLKRKRTQA